MFVSKGFDKAGYFKFDGVDEIETPLLSTDGEVDWREPLTQAEQLVVSVREQGFDEKLVINPGKHHNVGAPQRARHRPKELTSWFEKHDPEIETSPR